MKKNKNKKKLVIPPQSEFRNVIDSVAATRGEALRKEQARRQAAFVERVAAKKRMVQPADAERLVYQRDGVRVAVRGMPCVCTGGLIGINR